MQSAHPARMIGTLKSITAKVFQSFVSNVKLCSVILCVVMLMSATEIAGADDSQLFQFWRKVFSRPNADPNKTEAARLGRNLFSDPRLSGDGKRSCASCHNSALAFTDGRSRALARDGDDLARNTPTLLGIGYATVFNWDGSAESLERQALRPLLSPKELAADFADIIARLSHDDVMPESFAKAFPDRPVIDRENILASLAAYERTLVPPMTAFDKWVSGKADALTPLEQSGFRLFVGRAGCVACHVGWRFTDDDFHDIGLKIDAPPPDRDTAARKGLFAFKTPTLRAVTKTAPYMHDGRFNSLADVVDHYDSEVIDRRGLAGNMTRRLHLTAKEKAGLIAFLKTL